jgi:AbrB family looped-hinge helix DNA binding protein
VRTKLSTTRQVLLPGPLREQLGLKPGDPVDVKLDGDSIVLTPRRRQRRRGKIVIDPITGLPAVTAGPRAPILEHKQVKEILAEFP